jgi:tetratricopeptide (TPR) repeat protein
MTQGSRRRIGCAALLVSARQLARACVLIVLSVVSGAAQSRPPAESSPLEAAANALAQGRFDQVDSLLKGSSDTRGVVLRARADIERGRYAEAEKVLTPLAASAPGSDAALELGLLHHRLGRRTAANRALQGVLARVDPASAADYLRLGRAARALGQYQQANGYFRQANGLAPNDPLVNTEWGELFLEKYNRPEAMRSFQAVLKVNENYLPAQIGFARVAVDEDPPAARGALERVLKANPSSVPALMLSAEMALDDRKRAEARSLIQKALQVNPSNLEALALDAAISFLEGRTSDFNTQVGAILKINPVYGDAYRLAADHAARNYLFDEAVDLTRRALTVDRESTQAYADLGMHLLRTGDEPGARRALEAAFKADPYDISTFNLLSMLDTLDKFVTFRDGDLVVRLHPDEADVLREHVVPLAREALETLARRWEFTPKGPLLVEVFPKHDDFAVRTVGLPGMIGALGACFGRVVTMDSPKARPPGEFSWAETLWHEMAHVITLQMSNNRLPRWLSEGISVWEERRARPEWGREQEISFAQALDQKKVLKLSDLNEGFTNPQTISLAYYESSLLVDHLVRTYGEPKLRELLRAYGRGLETEAALKEAYNATLDELQVSFDAALERDFGRLRRALQAPEVPREATAAQLKALVTSNPDSFPLRMMLGQALQKAGDSAAAIAEFERAAQLLPTASGRGNPNSFIAAIALERKDTTRAIQALDAVVKVDHTDVESARKLAELVAPLGNAARTREAYERVVGLDPFDAAAQGRLGRLALERRDATSAARAFRVVLATNPTDRATAHADLAEAYVMAGQLAEAKRQALSALEIAPSFERAQDLLLKTVESGPASGGAR